MVRHSKATRERALEMLKAGHTSIYVGKLLDISDSTVRSWDRAERKKREAGPQEVGPDQVKLAVDIEIQVRKILDRVEGELSTVQISSTKDIKDIAAIIPILISARDKLNLGRSSTMEKNLSSKLTYKKFLETLSTREVRVLNHVLGTEPLEDITDEEGFALLEKMRQLAPFIPELAALVKAVDQAIRKKKEEESPEEDPSGEK